MERTTLTQLIRAHGGKVINSSREHANYSIPMNEENFLSFRENIPFVTLWHREENGHQLFGVFYNQLK
jgi:hypothetical protein